MDNKVGGYAALAAGADLAHFEFGRRDLRDDDVAINILYCGVCHSDLHQARNDWGTTRFPVVPGHEIVGRVSGIGNAVTRHRPGDIVGVGCMVDSCGLCGPCGAGEEQYCLERATMTYNGVDRHDGRPTYGGYSQSIIAREKFVLRIPDGLELKSAAPLLCAGITTYAPLRRYKAAPGRRVAVVGLGGLGHMGIRFAKAMGAEVTLITRSAEREREALRLGADRVLVSTQSSAMAAAGGSFDIVLDTVPTQHDLNPYLRTLKLGGSLILVGLIGHIEPPVHTGYLIAGRTSVVGSAIGGIAETQEMLDFCAMRGIRCDVEMIAMRDINIAFERLLRSDVRYRFVVDMSSMG